MAHPKRTELLLQPGDLFALRYVHDAQLSPDGARLAYVTSRSVERIGKDVFEITLETRSTASKEELDFPGCATFPRWSPDGKRLAFIGSTDTESRLYVTDAEGGNIRALTQEGRRVQGAPDWSPDGGTLAYAVLEIRPVAQNPRRITKRIFRAEGLGDIDALKISLERVDVASGSIAPLKIPHVVAGQPQFSPCGKRLLFLGSGAAAGYPPLDFKVFVLELETGRLSEVTNASWYVAAAAWSSDGERIVIAGDRDSRLAVPTARLWVVNPDGSHAECRSDATASCLGVHAHHDMPTWGTSQTQMFVVAGDYAYATVTQGGCAQISRISLRGPIQCEPMTSGPRTCVIFDASPPASLLLYGVTDLHKPWELFGLDLRTGVEASLTQLNDAVLKDWPALAIEHLTFQSADETPLEGWYLARADGPGPKPTVLFIHGGPELVSGHAFRFDFHLLAAHGFGVVFSNFRGSSGYGEAFREGLSGDWGARGFPDHMAAIDAAIERGLADPVRLGVWGPSHGGFATCWIVGHSDRFRAAVAESVVTNFATLYYLSDLPDVFARELGGRPDEVPEAYSARSPLSYAHRCRTPTLLLHGADDLRCSIVEAEQFYRALHDAGCKTELVRIPGMNHMGDSVGPLSARRAQNEALLEWFERYL